MASDCSYNKRLIGAQCQDCQVGYFGKNCTQPCEKGRYGPLCRETCHCDSNKCDHRFGCSTDDESGKTVDDGSFEYISTVSFSPGSSNYNVSTDDVISSTSQDFEMPSDTSNNPFTPNMQLSLIGGIAD